MLRYALVLAPLILSCSAAAEPPGVQGKPWVRKDPLQKAARPRELPDTPLSSRDVLQTRDRCGGHCRFTRVGESTLMLHLADDGVAEAADEGVVRERVRSVAGNHAQTITWQRRWKGEWTVRKRLHVTLKPVTQTCQSRVEDGVVDESCALPHELHLVCELVDLSLSRPPERSTRAWNCDAKTPSRAIGLSPLPWVFGTEDPVVVLDGGTRHAPTRRYSLETSAIEEEEKAAAARKAE
jgi:hypothetical protein